VEGRKKKRKRYFMSAEQESPYFFIPRTSPRSFFCPRCYAQIFSFLVTCSKVLEIEGKKSGESSSMWKAEKKKEKDILCLQNKNRLISI
jgi:hypothetical protein